jgi:predicted kinase
MKFIKKHFLNNLILVTGTHTSGKSMVSPIVASLSNVEILRKI